MVRLLVLAAVGLPMVSAHAASVQPLPPRVQQQLKAEGFYHRGCPVPLSGLRVLRARYRGFDGRSHVGRIVVNARAARPLARVFGQLYALHFPIRHMSVRPVGADTTASFSCRQAVPSPCTGGKGTGSWSMHAFGLAVDINPRENPYVGCGESRDPAARRYHDRSRHRRGMVTPRAIQAFRAIGWGWGGAWIGDTKDYMHFSSTGH